MSAAVPAITRDSHVAAGHGLGISQYIDEMESMGLSPRKIRQALNEGGLSVAPQQREPNCLQIQEAIERLDFYAAVSALRAFRKYIATREGQFKQLQCLRMRIEHRHGDTSDIYKMLLRVLKS